MTTANSLQVREIVASTVKQWMERKATLLIDVREPSEYTAEHIWEAQSVPLSIFRADKLPQAPGQQIVLYCQTGNRSAQAAQRLLQAGVKPVNHLQGGLSSWKAAGYPTKVDRNAPISLFRQVQITAGSLVFLGTVLGAVVSPWFLVLSGFIGTGLIFAGVTDTCAIAMLLAKLPYNQRAANGR